MMHRISFILCFLLLSLFAFTQDHNHSEGNREQSENQDSECHHEEAHGFDPSNTAFHHIADQNIYSIGPWHFPLPCIFYAPKEGWAFFSSRKFHADSHGIGLYANQGYVLFEGIARKVAKPAGFPKELIELGEHKLYEKDIVDSESGKKKKVVFVCYQGKEWACDNQSTADGGLFGGGITSFYDFSISKNVAAMLIVFFFLSWMFLFIARKYKEREGQAPSGLQGFIEPIFVFIQDEVAIPFLGKRWEEFLPFLQALFFFILALNLFGQIPFFGGVNITGNLAVTLVLAVLAFIVTNIHGNKHYWEHVFWMPDVPPILKVLIITPIEILGLFIKPITLMLRLFGNITAGHMVIVIFVGMIFHFGESGAYPAASYATAIGSTLLTLFMMSIELLVALIQAFVFTILTASYIGAATETAHH